jgi:hypothetical protein
MVHRMALAERAAAALKEKLMRLAAFVALALTGCQAAALQPLANVADSDLTNASALAAATGDAQGGQCWNALLAIAAFVQKNTGTVGLASVIQFQRSATAAFQGNCGSVALGIESAAGGAVAAAKPPLQQPAASTRWYPVQR